MKTNNNFYIVVHSDYHDIQDAGPFQSIELGCFPTKGDWCCNYVALYYKGRKPSFNKIKNSLFEKVDTNKNYRHGYTGDNISMTEEEISKEVLQKLKKISI